MLKFLLVQKLHAFKVAVTFVTIYYAPAYSNNSGWAFSITPVRPVRLSVRLYVPLRVRAITPKPYEIYS